MWHFFSGRFASLAAERGAIHDLPRYPDALYALQLHFQLLSRPHYTRFELHASLQRWEQAWGCIVASYSRDMHYTLI